MREFPKICASLEGIRLWLWIFCSWSSTVGRRMQIVLLRIAQVVLSCFDIVAHRVNKTTLGRKLVCIMCYRTYRLTFVPRSRDQGQSQGQPVDNCASLHSPPAKLDSDKFGSSRRAKPVGLIESYMQGAKNFTTSDNAVDLKSFHPKSWSRSKSNSRGFSAPISRATEIRLRRAPSGLWRVSCFVHNQTLVYPTVKSKHF